MTSTSTITLDRRRPGKMPRCPCLPPCSTMISASVSDRTGLATENVVHRQQITVGAIADLEDVVAPPHASAPHPHLPRDLPGTPPHPV